MGTQVPNTPRSRYLFATQHPRQPAFHGRGASDSAFPRRAWERGYSLLCSSHSAPLPLPAQVRLPDPSLAEPITVSAQAGNQWQLGAYEVWVLRGDCVIQQGQGYARSREAVLWIQRAEPTQRQPDKVIAYLEGDVEVIAAAGCGAGDRPDLAGPLLQQCRHAGSCRGRRPESRTCCRRFIGGAWSGGRPNRAKTAGGPACNRRNTRSPGRSRPRGPARRPDAACPTGAADSRLSPQRRARPIPVVSIRSEQQPVDRRHRFRGERHRRLDVSGSARSARWTFRPIGW